MSFFRALGAIERVVKFEDVFCTGREGDDHLFAQEFASNLSFKRQVTAVACDQGFRNWTAIAEFASPGTLIVGVCLKEATLFNVLSSVVISVEIATVNWVAQ